MRPNPVEVFKNIFDMIEDRFSRRGRTIRIDRLGIGGFAAQHYAENQHVRWNGWQIRNACQTALAVAEFLVWAHAPRATMNEGS
jgi:hypothetical protein